MSKGSFFELVDSCREPGTFVPIERRRLFVAAKLAGVKKDVIDQMDSQPYSGDDPSWSCRLGEYGFSGDLNYCLELMSDILDAVAFKAVLLRCLVYGKASPQDFEDVDRFDKGDWDIWSDRQPVAS